MNDVVPYTEKVGALSVTDVRSQVQLIQEIMRGVMKEGEHYGVIPGTDKPTLFKAGAEKLCLTFRLDPQYEEKMEREGMHLTVRTKCTLYHSPSGQRLGSGMGLCSSRESKYAFRRAARVCPNCKKETIIKGKAEYGGGWLCWKAKGGCGSKFADGDPIIEQQSEGRVDNPDLPDTWNTVIKMSAKRALVAAVLNTTAASDCFTQDLEDVIDGEVIGAQTKPERKPRKAKEPTEKTDFAAKLADAASVEELQEIWNAIPAKLKPQHEAIKNRRKGELGEGGRRVEL